MVGLGLKLKGLQAVVVLGLGSSREVLQGAVVVVEVLEAQGTPGRCGTGSRRSSRDSRLLWYWKSPLNRVVDAEVKVEGQVGQERGRCQMARLSTGGNRCPLSCCLVLVLEKYPGL